MLVSKAQTVKEQVLYLNTTYFDMSEGRNGGSGYCTGVPCASSLGNILTYCKALHGHQANLPHASADALPAVW